MNTTNDLDPQQLDDAHDIAAVSTTLKLTQWLDDHPRRWLTILGLITAALVVPFLALAPDESASTEPGGAVFDARDAVDDLFVSDVHPFFGVVEAVDGDLADADTLRSMLATHGDLRTDERFGPLLYQWFEPETSFDATGIVALPELVDRELAGTGGLATATDADVDAAIVELIDRYGERSSIIAISAASSFDGTRWTIPAISPTVLTDNELLGFGNVSVSIDGDTEIEEFDREIQEELRATDGVTVHGVAIDVNLTSQEQGAVAGPFIGFTILAVLLIVAATFRSYWVMATVGVALMALIVWLKGISNLIGLEDDLVLSLIVPIAMVSFGVDFAFHSVGRYREERTEGHRAATAIVSGLAAVSAALVLALTSDGVAFLSNVSSGIESIIQFGVGAAIALASAFVLLGVATPLVVAQIERRVAAPAPGRSVTLRRVGGAVAAASSVMASVLLMVFVLPAVGVVLAVLTTIGILVVPARRQARSTGNRVDEEPVVDGTTRIAGPIGRAVERLARRPAVVVAGALVVTVVMGVFAVRVPTEFDVEDFFSADTDFVTGLDLLDEHVGDRGGEPAQLYVEADLADPAVLAEVVATVDEVAALQVDSFARDDAGMVEIDRGVVQVFDEVWASPVAQSAIEQQTGITLTDSNADGIPDTREQVVAVIETSTQIGVPIDAERVTLTPDDVATSVVLGERSATVFELALVDSRAQQSVAAARSVLDPIAERLEARLDGSFVQVTGSPFVREASLDATSRALNVSLPIALALCLLVATVFLRSLRYGLASVAPIVMVVAWLYGFMELTGFAINLVTATIAAVSIGIGIDFAIHFIARYREELDRHGVRSTAIRVTGEGTGSALVASAVSSAVGFGILALAPMPLFAAYGLLTAIMIMMALVATLVVLPGILVLITSDSEPEHLVGQDELRG